MGASIDEATELARVVFPTPGKPQNRIVTGIKQAMSQITSYPLKCGREISTLIHLAICNFKEVVSVIIVLSLFFIRKYVVDNHIDSFIL
jgi:hypothetical protein